LRSWGQLLRIKEKEQFVWTEAHQKVFDSIKQYQTKPPVLMPPKQGPACDLVFICLRRINGMLACQRVRGSRKGLLLSKPSFARH
jgi:hypothetical protein